jgi:hypothetical protein
MSNIANEAGKQPAKTLPSEITLEEAIAFFSVMQPSAEVVMRREMGDMFPPIVGAIKRGADQDQIIDGLKKRWPTTHVATLTKLFNDERERRLQQGELVDINPLGSPRKPKKADGAVRVESVAVSSRNGNGVRS